MGSMPQRAVYPRVVRYPGLADMAMIQGSVCPGSRMMPRLVVIRLPVRVIFSKALVGLRGDGGTSHDQSRDEGAKESFAPAPGVVHELEEAEIQRQLLLRDAPVWPQPGA